MRIGIVGKMNWIIVIHFNFSLAEEDTPLARTRDLLGPSPQAQPPFLVCLLLSMARKERSSSWRASTLRWRSSSGDDEIDIDGGINLEGGDVLDDRRWAHHINNSFVDSHFVPVPGVGAFTAWRLPGGDSQDLGGNSDWAPGLESLVLGSRDHLAAGLLQVLHNSTLELHSEIQQNI